ncbi:ABC transporter ATP-binding protein [Riemerella anatipestifer]|uniref:ABC transporter ATP-binding protein n=1 Tax=Riemerella anatipestifer TaxID=34085 RepID=A0AAP6LMG3_RIEAN|nr:ABC transporter ATP-binding protein [Riemerella anatipestifer]MBT0548716.1 ABC transporter ATP-binding protein [Riemerella anatipestifer]MBT0555397.1 ABC transporter ATP-binding protein [Riemerella anatipestifer]MBT0559479.1 ABC transporter ATP-binding protein [Riemerella anatipestifer]MCD5968595.1 ABC transporter ATP-binding protein [Riemerella anatipestifer]MCE3023511.1 ABC transporter ATP-binding protein [Riemerella anatipestifer]
MIEIKNLTKTFGKFKALDSVNLLCKKGSSVAFIGPNGCGKTTLIKSILGLNTIESGQIFVNGSDVSEDNRYREIIGYMPQMGKYPENMTIQETLDIILDNRIYTEKLDTELMEAYDIDKLRHKKMGNLSGGTIQKVSAVIAFMFNPSIIILDEPTAGLDPIASEILKNKILKEQKKGKLIIITSHLLSELEQIVDEVVFLSEGQIMFHKKVEELKYNTQEKSLSKAITTILRQIQNV